MGLVQCGGSYRSRAIVLAVEEGGVCEGVYNPKENNVDEVSEVEQESEVEGGGCRGDADFMQDHGCNLRCTDRIRRGRSHRPDHFSGLVPLRSTYPTLSCPSQQPHQSYFITPRTVSSLLYGVEGHAHPSHVSLTYLPALRLFAGTAVAPHGREEVAGDHISAADINLAQSQHCRNTHTCTCTCNKVCIGA